MSCNEYNTPTEVLNAIAKEKYNNKYCYKNNSDGSITGYVVRTNSALTPFCKLTSVTMERIIRWN